MTRNQYGSDNLNWQRHSPQWQLSTFETLSDDIAHISLNTFGNSNIVNAFEEKIDRIQQHHALIIDLRNNGGGNSGNGYAILQYFTDQPFLTSKWRTRQHRPAYKAWGGFIKNKDRTTLQDWKKVEYDYYYDNIWHESQPDTIPPHDSIHLNMPFVVLIDHNTASAAEDFLVALDDIGKGTVIGRPTFGSTGQPMFIRLPGGGRARICTKRDTYPDGREFVGYGVQPDIVVEPTIESLMAEEDVILQRAIQELKK